MFSKKNKNSHLKATEYVGLTLKFHCGYIPVYKHNKQEQEEIFNRAYNGTGGEVETARITYVHLHRKGTCN